MTTKEAVLTKATGGHLEAARQAARGDPPDPHKRFRLFRYGPRIERARSNLDAAEAHLLTLAPNSYILGQMPCLLNHVQRPLPPTDARRQEFERIARRLGPTDQDHPLLQKDHDAKLATQEEPVTRERR